MSNQDLKDSLLNLEKGQRQLLEKLDVANNEILFIQKNQTDEFTQLNKQLQELNTNHKSVVITDGTKRANTEHQKLYRKIEDIEGVLLEQKESIELMNKVDDEEKEERINDHKPLAELEQGLQKSRETRTPEHEVENGQETPNAKQQPTQYKIITFSVDRCRSAIKQSVFDCLITDNKPHLIFVQECPDPNLNSSEYIYSGKKEASPGLIYHTEFIKIKGITFNFDVEGLKLFREAELNKCVYLCKVKYQINSTIFICISWHGWRNSDTGRGTFTDKVKLKQFSYFLSLLTLLLEEFNLPLLVGGNFNINLKNKNNRKEMKRQITETKKLKLYKYKPPSEQKKLTNYFISTTDLNLLEPQWLDLTGKIEHNFAHKPVGVNIDW